MKYFEWNEDKNKLLQLERDVTFEDVLVALSEGNLLDLVAHPNKKKYPNQMMIIVEIREYVYIVPFIEDDEKIFLKTIIPSRVATKNYLFNKKII